MTPTQQFWIAVLEKLNLGQVLMLMVTALAPSPLQYFKKKEQSKEEG